MKPLRAIFLDIDDTLYSTTEFARTARGRAVDNMIRAGLRLSRDDALRELDEVIDEFSSNYGNHFDKLLARIPPIYCEGLSRPMLVAAAVVGYHETKQRLRAYEDVIDFLRKMTATPARVGVISNGLAVKQMEKLIRLGVAGYFDQKALFISEEIGIAKPNVKLFLKACRDLDVSPEHAMYVGDHPDNDIDPPNAIGMISVLAQRGGHHEKTRGRSAPAYTIGNFWDLLEIIERDFEL